MKFLLSIFLFSVLPIFGSTPTDALQLIVAKKQASAGFTATVFAWYDMASTTASFGGLNLENLSASFQTASSPEYGIGATPSARFRRSSFGSSWGNIEGDYWFAVRFRVYTGIANNDYIFGSNNTRYYVRWAPTAGGVRVGLADFNVVVPISGQSIDTWYQVSAHIDASENRITAWVNAANQTTTTGTEVYNNGDLIICGNGTSGYNVHIDWIGFGTGLLNGSDLIALYNSGNTLTYGDL